GAKVLRPARADHARTRFEAAPSRLETTHVQIPLGEQPLGMTRCRRETPTTSRMPVFASSGPVRDLFVPLALTDWPPIRNDSYLPVQVKAANTSKIMTIMQSSSRRGAG